MAAHALLVGISQFDDPKLAKLNSPQSDVEAFASVLKDPARGGFDSVTVSIDQDVLTIRDKLSFLMDSRSADDMVLLYYSGHGIVAKGQRLYLATGQSSFDRPQARSIATNEVRDLMEQSRAGRLVVILDCCHSGVFAEGAKGAEAPAMTDSTFGDATGAEGQYVLTATDALQYAYDGAGALREAVTNGPVLSRFTRWLVDGIGNGEASPFDEQITLDALYQYLCRRARSEQAGMTPQRFVKRGSGEMVIAKNPLGKQLVLPDELIARLDSPDWKVRKDAVAELGKLAKQPNMVPLVKKAVLDRVSIDRDVDVREAMVRLMQQLGLAQPDRVTPEPEPRPSPPPRPAPPPQPAPAPVQPAFYAPPQQPASFAPPPALSRLDSWQTKVLVKSGVATSSLMGPNAPYILVEMERRANALRTATYMHHSYIVGAGLFGLGAIGQIQEKANMDDVRGAAFMLLILIGFGVAGLFNRRTIPAGPSENFDPDLKRLQEAVPIVESWWGWGFGKRAYEAKLFHRACWWMVIIETCAFLFILTQL